MYVRLGLANPKEGMTEDALNYFRDVAIPVYDQVNGLLGAAACINNAGQLMAWTTWVNNEAKEAAMSEFQQNLAGLADFITEPPTILEGPMVAGQQYIMVPKDGKPNESVQIDHIEMLIESLVKTLSLCCFLRQ